MSEKMIAELEEIVSEQQRELTLEDIGVEALVEMEWLADRQEGIYAELAALSAYSAIGGTR